MAETVTVTALGHRGDGIVQRDGGDLFVPFTLPGEDVAVDAVGDRGWPLAILTPSPSRTAPYCPWYGRCGGCALQHAQRAFELDWKRDLVSESLRQRGLSADVAPCRDAHGDGRRRVTLHVRSGPDGVRAGFMAARSHDLVPVDACPLLVPALAPAFAVATCIGEILAPRGKPLDVQVTAVAAGLDVDVRGAGPVGERLRQALIDLADTRGLVRLSLHGDRVYARQPPTVAMGPAAVDIPAGGFLQATAAAEEVLAGLVIAALGKSRAVLDLFAGCGPFALRIARQAKVHAVEFDAAATAALLRAARHTPGLKPVTAEARDLYRRPVLSHEMAGFDAAVFDPPRNGAEAQAQQFARASQLRTLVAVSCNPATFARDARLLCDGGWRLTEVTPVDQFRHAAHVELVAVFRR